MKFDEISKNIYCPECGGQMVKRRPKLGDTWETFWGCREYPNCRGTREIFPDGSVESDDDVDIYDWMDE